MDHTLEVPNCANYSFKNCHCGRVVNQMAKENISSLLNETVIGENIYSGQNMS